MSCWAPLWNKWLDFKKFLFTYISENMATSKVIIHRALTETEIDSGAYTRDGEITNASALVKLLPTEGTRLVVYTNDGYLGSYQFFPPRNSLKYVMKSMENALLSNIRYKMKSEFRTVLNIKFTFFLECICFPWLVKNTLWEEKEFPTSFSNWMTIRKIRSFWCKIFYSI